MSHVFNLIYKRFCHGLKSMVCDDAITWWTVVLCDTGIYVFSVS